MKVINKTTGFEFNLPGRNSVTLMHPNKGASIRKFKQITDGLPISFRGTVVLNPALNLDRLDRNSILKLQKMVA